MKRSTIRAHLVYGPFSQQIVELIHTAYFTDTARC